MLLSICLLVGSNGPKFEATLSNMFAVFGGYCSVELIVSDSSGNGLVGFFCGSYPEVVYLENHGASYADNLAFAFEKASGKFVWFLTCGDSVHGHVGEALGILDESESAYFHISIFDELDNADAGYGYKLSQFVMAKSVQSSELFKNIPSSKLNNDWGHVALAILAIAQNEKLSRRLISPLPLKVSITRDSGGWWLRNRYIFLRLSLECLALEKYFTELLMEEAPRTARLIEAQVNRKPSFMCLTIRSFSYSSESDRQERMRIMNLLIKKPFQYLFFVIIDSSNISILIHRLRMLKKAIR